jgi:hypothetical protein
MNNNNSNLKEKRFIVPERRSLQYDEEMQKIYRFDPSEIRVVRLGAPYPAAYVKSERNRNWMSYSPQDSFPFLFDKPSKHFLQHEDEKQRNYAEFKLTLYNKLVTLIGEDKIHLLRQFPSRHWFLYCFLERCGDYAYDLLSSNPALGYLLSAHALFHPLKSKSYWRSARTLLLKKRKDILDYFGFPGKETTVKILAKIVHKSIKNKVLFTLRKNLREKPDLLRTLSFYSKHNESSLYILNSDLIKVFHSNFIDQIAQGKLGMNRHYFFHLVKDIKRMQAVLAENNVPPKTLLFKSSFDVELLHDELMNSINSFQSKSQNYVFPDSPLPDVKNQDLHIESIKNSAMLYAEGKEMNHCIYSYCDELKKGDHFAARMLHPQRLTLFFRKDSKRCRLLEVRGKNNALPKNELLTLIDQWLSEYIRPEDPNQLTLFDYLFEFEERFG